MCIKKQIIDESQSCERYVCCMKIERVVYQNLKPSLVSKIIGMLRMYLKQESQGCRRAGPTMRYPKSLKYIWKTPVGPSPFL